MNYDFKELAIGSCEVTLEIEYSKLYVHLSTPNIEPSRLNNEYSKFHEARCQLPTANS